MMTRRLPRSNGHLAATLLTCAALSACGGGSGGDDVAASDNAAPAATPATETPAALTPFKSSGNAAFIVRSVGLTSTGVLDAHTQRGDGALTKLGKFELSGEAVVREIHGDADYALGRWVAGNVVDTRSTGTLTDTGGAYVYVAFNRLEALPTSGAPTCDSGTFTASTRVGGTALQAPHAGTASGSARLTFAESGAAISVTLKASNGSSQETITVNGTVARVSDFTFPGGIGGNGNAAILGVGKSGDAYQVVGSYTVNLPDSSRYAGAFRFRCG
jgi:hypothetical protein